MIIEEIPEGAKIVLNQYLNLKINNITIQSPYYINARKQRAGLRVMVGKGSPDEIIQETLIFAKLRNVSLETITEDELRKFMGKVGIGIECSGFVTYILDSWLTSQGKKHVWKYLKYPKESLVRKFIRFIRPIENISAFLLTSDLNTDPINQMQQIRPGDLIRSVGITDGYHIAVVSKVIKDDQNNLVEFEYAHSTRFYDDKHGVRVGKIIVKDKNSGLHSQEFTDSYKGRDWFHEEIERDKEYAGVRRLKTVPLY